MNLEQIISRRTNSALRGMETLRNSVLLVDSTKKPVPIENVFSGSVCVVGNSPALLGSNLGARINAFDTVVRINDFSIAGHSEDVGTKQTVWLTCCSKQSRVKARDTSVFNHSVYLSPRFHELDEQMTEVRMNLKVPPEKLFYFNSLELYRRVGKICYPTTGNFILLILSSILHRPIYSAGFCFYKTGVHYYAPRNDIKHFHSFSVEKLVYRELLNESRVVSLHAVDLETKLSIFAFLRSEIRRLRVYLQTFSLKPIADLIDPIKRRIMRFY